MSPLVRQSGRDPVSQDPGPRGTHFRSSPGSLARSGVVEERGGLQKAAGGSPGAGQQWNLEMKRATQQRRISLQRLP